MTAYQQAEQEVIRKKTHCKHGHPWTDDNIYIQPSTGGKLCRACAKAVPRKYLRERISNLEKDVAMLRAEVEKLK